MSLLKIIKRRLSKTIFDFSFSIVFKQMLQLYNNKNVINVGSYKII